MNFKMIKKIIADYSGYIDSEDITEDLSLFGDLQFDDESIAELLDAITDELGSDFSDYDYEDDDSVEALINYIKYQ